ncbi:MULTISPECIES: M23 family metallopeptidase [unclassified Lentimicrobium]|uniref:M23 family metallopeptidase n=1 Tax=unclassified Lentimicrobium TaxID=2677434 RepID=UPI0015539CEB|nr:MULTISPECIES: peptidoglycan DD-metalloendopeptidase family protein [unclassified Lentimicrobium]NPD47157.1 peptidoglycan DD-metalloendopeptidase family protein [Lentimicrobium sp. S6]NPD83682.1 peptidoglycan DD-metalloendopeptidase family protein [Lentimicrobium sp. L6]
MNYRYFFILLLVVVFVSCKNEVDQQEEFHVENDIVALEENLFFNINVDSLEIETFRIKKNENISDILSDHGIAYSSILELVENSKDIFNVKKIRRGNNYHLLKSNDSIAKCEYMIYEKNRVDYVVFQFADSVLAWEGAKEVRRVLDTVAGVVESSLWVALQKKNANPQLAMELSDIYSWTVDFFGIRKGDHFNVLFEHLIVDEDTIGIGNVYAANFNHYSTDYQAYYFVQDSIGEFFDEKGNSLRKTFLKAPLRYSRISSGFSNNRFHPVLKKYRPHHGIDYAAPSGTPVYTIGDGTVIKKGYQKRGGGNYIKVKHNANYTTVYMHLKGFAKGIHVGQRLKQGDLVGYVGATGLATGPHLDFRVYRNGLAINPLKMKSTPAKPVDSTNRVEYQTLVDSLQIYIKQENLLDILQ